MTMPTRTPVLAVDADTSRTGITTRPAGPRCSSRSTAGREAGFILSKQRHHRFLENVQRRSLAWTPRMSSFRIGSVGTASGAAFGDLPPLASHRRCERELRNLFTTADSFKPFNGKVLSGPEFAKLLLEA